MASQNTLENELSGWNDAIQNRSNDPKAYVRRGMVNFKLAKIAESIQDFDQAEKLDPTIKPYLWQRGLSYYYAERFEEGALQFEVDLSVNAQDVEDTVWRYLCIACQRGVTEARNSLLLVRNDPRLVMRRVYELYAGDCIPDEVLAAGELEGKRGKFYSHLYVGLYYEAESDAERSREYIVKSAEEYKLDDYMWYLACVHLKLQGWA